MTTKDTMSVCGRRPSRIGHQSYPIWRRQTPTTNELLQRLYVQLICFTFCNNFVDEGSNCSYTVKQEFKKSLFAKLYCISGNFRQWLIKSIFNIRFVIYLNTYFCEPWHYIWKKITVVIIDDVLCKNWYVLFHSNFLYSYNDETALYKYFGLKNWIRCIV